MFFDHVASPKFPAEAPAGCALAWSPGRLPFLVGDGVVAMARRSGTPLQGHGEASPSCVLDCCGPWSKLSAQCMLSPA
jgi:hypothetical protein